MPAALRRLFAHRMAVPAALVGAVAIVGLLAFSPAAAQASGSSAATPYSVPTSTVPSCTRPPAPPRPSAPGRCRAPSSVLAYDASANQAGHLLRFAAQGLRRPRGGPVRLQLLELPRARSPRDHPGPQPAGARGRHRRLLGVHRPHAPGGLQRAGHPQAAPVQPPPDPGDRRMGAVPHPGGGRRRSRWSTPTRPTSSPGAPCSPSTAPPATPSPAPATPSWTVPTPPASTSPPPPRSSRPSVRARATCPVSVRGNITNAEARDIAAYVTGVIQHPADPGGVGLGGIGPVGEGFVGLLVGVGVLMLVCFWIGDRT